jgi:threonine aldolase
MIDRLAEDHANARRLAEAIAGLPGIASPGGTAQPAAGRLDPERVRTNFVIFRVERDRAAFLDAVRARGVLLVEYPHDTVRAVTHHGIEAADVDEAVAAIRFALDATAPVRTIDLPAASDQPTAAAPA